MDDLTKAAMWYCNHEMTAAGGVEDAGDPN